MKKVTYGLCLLASVMFVAAVADAQTSGGASGAGTSGAASSAGTSAASSGPGSSPTAASSADPSNIPTGSATAPGTAGARGNFGTPQQGAGTQQPSLPGPQPNQFNQPTALAPQTGPRSELQDPGIQTRRNFDATNGRFDESMGASGRTMSPPDRQAQGFDAEMQTRGQQRGNTVGQRGELGVWLVTTGGPGVQIRQVTRGSAAEQIGLRPGDMILGINGRGVTTAMEVQRLVRGIPVGQTATLAVLRDGAQQDVTVTLQPMRDAWRSGYRGAEGIGAEMASSRGDLESRTMQLEEQLNSMMRELRQLRADMAQMPAGSGQPAETGFHNEQSAMPQETSTFDDAGTQTGSNEFDQPSTAPAPSAAPEASTAEPTPAAPSATEPAATEPSTAEPSTTEPADDLFGSESTESESTATPAEQPATETETESESNSDLFQ